MSLELFLLVIIGIVLTTYVTCIAILGWKLLRLVKKLEKRLYDQEHR